MILKMLRVAGDIPKLIYLVGYAIAAAGFITVRILFQRKRRQRRAQPGYLFNCMVKSRKEREVNNGNNT